MQKFYGKSILFVHTGGHIGLYDKADELQPLTSDAQILRFRME